MCIYIYYVSIYISTLDDVSVFSNDLKCHWNNVILAWSRSLRKSQKKSIVLWKQQEMMVEDGSDGVGIRVQ